MLRGVLPIGLWLITITLSISWPVKISSCDPALSRELCNFCISPRYKISYIRVDLPLPDTPVTSVSTPVGIATSIFLRLFSLHPFSWIHLLDSLLTAGVSIVNCRDRYCPVKDSGFASISSGVPFATIRPPCNPAPGPISTT